MVQHDAASAKRRVAAQSVRDPQAIHRLALAVQELDRAEDLARPDELARSTLGVAHCYAELGMHDTAEWYYRQALAATRHLPGAEPLVQALTGLAEALSLRSRDCIDAADRYSCLERARDLAFQAAALASGRLPAAREASVLDRLADLLCACGDRGDADALRERSTSLSRHAGPRTVAQAMPGRVTGDVDADAVACSPMP